SWRHTGCSVSLLLVRGVSVLLTSNNKAMLVDFLSKANQPTRPLRDQMKSNSRIQNTTDAIISAMNKKLLSQVMSELGKRTSKANAAAARKNGKLGGRPRKAKR